MVLFAFVIVNITVIPGDIPYFNNSKKKNNKKQKLKNNRIHKKLKKQ